MLTTSVCPRFAILRSSFFRGLHRPSFSQLIAVAVFGFWATGWSVSAGSIAVVRRLPVERDAHAKAITIADPPSPSFASSNNQMINDLYDKTTETNKAKCGVAWHENVLRLECTTRKPAIFEESQSVFEHSPLPLDDPNLPHTR